jgi:hypothetical protein
VAVLSRRLYKEVEWRLYHYHELRRQAKELRVRREAMLNPGRTPASPGGGGISYRSDPTATNTLRRQQLADQQIETERWVAAIEQTIERYQNHDKGQLLELKYFSDVSDDYICGLLNIERSTFYSWTNELVTFTALVAVQYGLVRVS